MRRLLNTSIFSLLLISSLSSCKKLYEQPDITNNPNAVTDVDVRTLLSGTLLGVSLLHEDVDVRIANIWAGELNGLSRAHLTYASYIVSSSTFNWTPLYPVASQTRLIQTKADAISDKWTKGVGQVLEALVIAKATDLYGDIPYSQAFDIEKFPTPVYDKQADVYVALQKVLDDAIQNLSAPAGLAFTAEDFIYKGNVARWKAAAYTLKARLYLHTGEYANAATAAGSGITGTAGDALIPHGNSQGVDLNQSYDFFRLTRSGDAGFDGAYLPVLMRSRSGSANVKTDETALFNHFFRVGAITAGALDPNLDNGMFARDAPHPIITYYENQLTLAEAWVRTGANDQALAALNSVRAALATGYFNGKTISATGRKYEAYTLDDFGAGGIANPRRLASVQLALLNEIISQRYIVLLMQYEAFNDVRRLEKAVPVVQLPIPLYAGTQKPARFIYPQNEINTNPNVPSPVPTQFEKVQIFK
jgi:hypothetical protein